MNSDLIHRIAKERYQREHDRKDQINNSLSIPITVVAALIGVAGYFLINIPLKVIFVSPAWIKIIFVVLILMLSCLAYCLIQALRFLNKVFFGLEYGYIPTPKAMKGDAEKSREYYKKYFKMNKNQLEQAIEKDMQSALLDNYCESIENNVACNKSKAFFLTKAKRSITMALVVLSISVLPFIVIHHHGQLANENIQKIEIIRSK